MLLALRILLAAVMIVAGIKHFTSPKGYVRIVPAALPAKLALVYFTGVCEILGGAGLLLPLTQRLAAWCLAVFFVAVFPANINMAVNKIPMGQKPMPTWAYWARLPIQAVLIAWAWLFT